MPPPKELPNKARNQHILHIKYIEDIIDAVYVMVIDGLTLMCKGKAKGAVIKDRGEGAEANEEKAPKILYTSETCKDILEPQFGGAKYFDTPVIQTECKF